LSLPETTITDESTPVLEQLVRLQGLHLGGSGISVRGLDSLRRLKSLEQLSLSHVRSGGAPGPVFADLPRLKELSLNDCHFQQLYLARHPSLDDIHGDTSTIDSLCMEDCPRLRRIDFSRLGVREFRFVRLPQAEWLHLSIVQGTEVQSATLRDLPRLEHLALIGITPEGAIEHLTQPVRVVAADFQDASGFGKLSRVDLSGIVIPPAAREALPRSRR
jgi:hypothetical protein